MNAVADTDLLYGYSSDLSFEIKEAPSASNKTLRNIRIGYLDLATDKSFRKQTWDYHSHEFALIIQGLKQSTYQEVEVQAKKSTTDLYILKHVIINSIGLMISFTSFTIALLVNNIYVGAVSFIVMFGFFEMLITVLVDKRSQ